MGAKNNPKDLKGEYEKVRQLYKDRGVDFPADGGSGVVKPKAPRARVQDKAGRHNPDPALEFNVGDQQGGDQGAGLECGSCHSELDQEYESCPFCGCGLTWTQ